MTIIRHYIQMIGMLAVMIISLTANIEARGATAPRTLPSYVRIIADGKEVTSTYTPDSIFYRIAGQTIFKVNRTQLRPNDPFIKELTDSVLPYANRAGWALVAIDLRGAASPEGPYDNNVRLSKGRAKAMRDFLSNHLDSVQINEIETTTVAEDYSYLLWLLERDGDSAAPLLRRIMAEQGADNHEAIKRELKKLYGGRYWARLLKDYYPKLRSARLVLYFERITPSNKQPQLDEIVITTPELEAPNFSPELHNPVLRKLPKTLERPHMFAVSTNLLYDAFYMPQFGFAPMLNIGLEWFPRNSPWTLRAQFTSPYYHKWDQHKFFQIRDYHLEVRRYFRPGYLHTGFYGAVYANAAKYGIGLSDTKGWQGEGIGGALKIGYVLPLGSGRWKLDFHIAGGAFVTKYDPYVYGNPVTGEVDDDYYYDWTGAPEDFHRRNHRLTWFGPTEIGITISYDLLYYRMYRGGTSVLRKEVIR